MDTQKPPFIFKDWDWNLTNKTLACHYQVEDHTFTETFTFNCSLTKDLNQALLNQAFTGLWIMAGISYFKAFYDRPIQVQNHAISHNQGQFFKTVYEKGLGEFCFENQIPLLSLHFPSQETAPNPDTKLSLSDEVIIPLGGGKDSLTTVELIKQSGLTFSTWTVGQYQGLEKSLAILKTENPNHTHQTVLRQVDLKIKALNQAGAPNGHVPISAIWAFISVCTAILSGKKYLAFSNENSANEPTMHYDGQPINHQYSKSLEFEQAFQAYVNENITSEIKYFSALRPLEELFIAEIFARTAWEKHKFKFSSCNRNFHLNTKNTDFHWCGKCPKCAFVFTILAPFIDNQTLTEVIGTNCFTDPDLQPIFADLLGTTNQKPFECVGTINEVRQALLMAQTNFPESKPLLNSLKPDTGYDYKNLAPHAIPDAIWRKLKPTIDAYV